MLNLIEEHSRECLAIRAGTKMEFGEGVRGDGRRDGEEGRAGASSLRQRVLSSSPGICGNGSPARERRRHISSHEAHGGGYCESFNSKLRDELLNGEIFYSMKEIRVLAATDHRRQRPGLQRAWGVEMTNKVGALH